MKNVIKFATKAHKGQVSKYTREPFINCPVRASSMLIKLYPAASEEMQFASVLHKTIRHTPTTKEQIEEKFGKKVAELVYWLTDISCPEDGNEEITKEIDRKHIAAAPFDAQIIKLAILINTTKTIFDKNPTFAKIYLNERSGLITVMQSKVKETDIWKEANSLFSKSQLLADIYSTSIWE